jgi:cytochrome c oxidase subunit III
MSTNKKTRSSQADLTGFKRMEKFHPFKTLLFFGLVGSTVLFLSMAFLYFITISKSGAPENFQLPKAFSVSTVFLLLSSFTIAGAVKAFRKDALQELKFSVIATLGLGIVFCLSQALGLKKMIDAGFFISSNVGVAYLYVITGMHFMHVAGGMLYLLVFTYRIMNASGDMVKSLMFFTNEYQLTRLQLTTIYWHFVDVLWVVLYFMFLFSF